MVSQKLVEQVMEKLDRPCTPRDIANYIIENGLSTIKSDISNDISTALNQMRKWEIVDKFPDYHSKTLKSGVKWSLTKNGNPHDPKTCKQCHKIVRAHNKNIAQYMIRSTNR